MFAFSILLFAFSIAFLDDAKNMIEYDETGPFFELSMNVIHIIRQLA